MFGLFKKGKEQPEQTFSQEESEYEEEQTANAWKLVDKSTTLDSVTNPYDKLKKEAESL